MRLDRLGWYGEDAGEGAADDWGNLLELVHHDGELVGIERLRAV
jgi:hypothetical protein